MSSVIAVVLIGSAYALSGPLPFHTKTANAESTHDLLVAYASKDSDNDGLPDWEESLYGTDPNNPHSVRPDMLDGEAVSKGLVQAKFANATSTPIASSNIPGVNPAPSTITDQFAREFFSQYLSQNNGQSPTPDQVATFVEQSVTSLDSQQAHPDAYNQGQVHVSGSGSDALLTYAATAENVFAKGAVKAPKNEVEYLSDAVLKDDATALSMVAKIGKYYTATAAGYIATPVPSEAAVPHLAVANALARMGSDITDMAAINSDPLRGYLGLASYQKDAPALAQALAALDTVYRTEQVTVPTGTAGSSFFAALEQSAAVVNSSQH